MYKTTYPLRPAIVMIELIFAIVIIAIVLLSAPQLIATATKSGYVAIQQEAINEAATQVNMILGYSWDANNTNETFLPPVLRVTHGDGDLNESLLTGRRSGTPSHSYRSFYRSDGLDFNASAIGDEGGTLDDMDDFNGNIGLISIESSSADYIETDTVKIATVVHYGTDACTGGTYKNPGIDHEIVYTPTFSSVATPSSNIKYISVRLTSNSSLDELDKNISFNAFSSNIGGFQLEERVY